MAVPQTVETFMTDPQWQKRQEDFFDANLPPPSTAGHFQWSDAKLRELRPELFGISGMFYSLFVMLKQQFNDRQFIKECLDGGDCRAAVVMSVSPLLVAAYSDELDCVAMLRFPDHFVQKYQLVAGSRLLTVNNYATESGAADLVPGPRNTGNWDNMIPIIADFASDDANQILQIKHKISAAEWERCYLLGQRHLQTRPNVARDGRPFFSGMPLAGAQEYEQNLKRAQRFRMLIPVIGGGVLLLLLFCGGALMFGPNMLQNRRHAAQRAEHDKQVEELRRKNPALFPQAQAVPALAAGTRVEVQWQGKWQPGEVIESLGRGEMVRVKVQMNQPGFANAPPIEPVLPRHMIRVPN
jgi:hypothetical protein